MNVFVTVARADLHKELEPRQDRGGIRCCAARFRRSRGFD